MKCFKIVRIFLILGVVLLISIITKAQVNSVSHENNSKHVSIAGLWRCTPETALHFETITVEATIHISRKVPSEWNVQGCFMWEGRFRDYWPLSNFQFIDSINQVTFKDIDGSVYIGTVDEAQKRINGTVYFPEGDTLVPEDKLNFIRVNDVTVNRLFTPRKPDHDGSIKYFYQIPKQGYGLNSQSIYSHVNDSLAVFDLMSQIINQEFGRIESFLIVKDNELVLEEYFYDYHPMQLHNIFSCTKSVVSLLTGIALERNGILDMERSVFNLFPQYQYLETSENKGLTLKHIFTMSAGFEEAEDYKWGSADSLLAHILCMPMVYRPGEKFSYNSECPYLLGGIIQLLEGKPIDQFANEHLFQPLGITNYSWDKNNDLPHCDSDLFMLPRDMAKIAIMVLNGGNWHGKQVVPEKWIKELLKPQINESDFLDYGYLWWHRSSENKAWWREKEGKRTKENDMAFALGFGGQYIFVICELNLAVIITSSDYNESNGMAICKIPLIIEEVVPLFETN